VKLSIETGLTNTLETKVSEVEVEGTTMKQLKKLRKVKRRETPMKRRDAIDALYLASSNAFEQMLPLMMFTR
jgi:hypothetical protein